MIRQVAQLLIDGDRILLEQVLLNLAMNAAACGCAIESEDPRWGALRVLKKV